MVTRSGARDGRGIFILYVTSGTRRLNFPLPVVYLAPGSNGIVIPTSAPPTPPPPTSIIATRFPNANITTWLTLFLRRHPNVRFPSSSPYQHPHPHTVGTCVLIRYIFVIYLTSSPFSCRLFSRGIGGTFPTHALMRDPPTLTVHEPQSPLGDQSRGWVD